MLSGIAAYFVYCRIFSTFQRSAHIAKFSQHKLAFSTTILISSAFLLPILLLGFVTSTIWLPTEWHHPCVWTPVHGTRWGSWFQAILYHLPAYFRCVFGIYAIRIFLVKMSHKTDTPNCLSWHQKSSLPL